MESIRLQNEGYQFTNTDDIFELRENNCFVIID